MKQKQSTGGAWKKALVVVIVCWLAVVATEMVTDVWDESRALNLFESEGFLELVTSNWRQEEATGVVLFRPIPFLVVTAIALPLQDPELMWRGLRAANAILLIASATLLVSFANRLGGRDGPRDLLLVTALLFSGSALITAGWFANAFDAMALFFIVWGLWMLAGGRGTAAGCLIGTAMFCKEVALLALPLVAILLWLEPAKRKQGLRALTIAVGFFVVYVLVRWVVVAPGSPSDLRTLSAHGFVHDVWWLCQSFWWQVADPPVRWLGAAAVAVSVAGMLRLKAAVGFSALLVSSAMLYGPLLRFDSSPLISPANFAGRLYLVPAFLGLTLVAVYGRRTALLVLLVPIVWGAAMTVDRHVSFQRAYLGVYELAARSNQQPLEVDSPQSRSVLRNDFRGVVIGDFPDADWEFRLDGTLVRRHPREQPCPSSLAAPQEMPTERLDSGEIAR